MLLILKLLIAVNEVSPLNNLLKVARLGNVDSKKSINVNEGQFSKPPTVLPKDVTVSAKLIVAVFRLVHPVNFPPKSLYFQSKLSITSSVVQFANDIKLLSTVQFLNILNGEFNNQSVALVI